MKKSQISVFVFSLLFSNLVAQINVEGQVLFKNKNRAACSVLKTPKFELNLVLTS